MTRSILDARMTEADWLGQVVDYAHLRGWLCQHARPALTSKGYRTAIQGDVGFPDLVMARDGRVIFAELKSTSGSVRPEQRRWLDELAKVAYVTAKTSFWQTLAFAIVVAVIFGTTLAIMEMVR